MSAPLGLPFYDSIERRSDGNNNDNERTATTTTSKIKNAAGSSSLLPKRNAHNDTMGKRSYEDGITNNDSESDDGCTTETRSSSLHRSFVFGIVCIGFGFFFALLSYCFPSVVHNSVTDSIRNLNLSIAKKEIVMIPEKNSENDNHHDRWDDNSDKDDEEDADILAQAKESSTIENATNGAVASDHPLCSELGLSILRDLNGNAVDAAVATTLCLGVANPASSGMGGGGFILIYADALEEKESEDENEPKYHDARDNGDDAAKNKKKKTAEVIDCREVAGSLATADMYVKENTTKSSLYGGSAVGVPGELRGLEVAHSRYGRLPWAAVVEPVADMAKNGIIINNHLASEIESTRRRALALLRAKGPEKEETRYGTLRRLITKHNDWNTTLKEGDVLFNPGLAQTLESVVIHGAEALYGPEPSERLANELQQRGGTITAQDIQNYYPTIRTPVVSSSVDVGDGVRVVGVPPPSSGGAVIIGALRFLSHYASPPLSSKPETLSVHRLAEALKHVFAVRMALGDPSPRFASPSNKCSDNETTTTPCPQQQEPSCQEAVDDLVSGPYMESLQKITSDNGVLLPSGYGGSKYGPSKDYDDGYEAKKKKKNAVKDAKEGDRRFLSEQDYNDINDEDDYPFRYLDDHGTSHLSVVDTDGNAVAITTTINTVFGSCLVSESTGIIFNNEMDDFSNPGEMNYFGLQPSERNFVRPGKKPLSSMSPTMIFRRRQQQNDGDSSSGGDDDEEDDEEELIMVLGGSGGPKIITAVLQVLLRYTILGGATTTLFEAMEHPRIHEQLFYHGSLGPVGTENTRVDIGKIDDDENHNEQQVLLLNVSSTTRNDLLNRGQQLFDVDYTGCVQAIAIDYCDDHDPTLSPNNFNRTTTRQRIISAVSDIRKGGLPAAY